MFVRVCVCVCQYNGIQKFYDSENWFVKHNQFLFWILSIIYSIQSIRINPSTKTKKMWITRMTIDKFIYSFIHPSIFLHFDSIFFIVCSLVKWSMVYFRGGCIINNSHKHCWLKISFHFPILFIHHHHYYHHSIIRLLDMYTQQHYLHL